MTYPNLYHLRYFVDAVELGSISAAARKNLVTHPAISRAISSMESQLGVELLVHQKKIFKVTEAGRQIAEQARELIKAADGFTAADLVTGDNMQPSLSIGISRSLSDSLLNNVLDGLIQKYSKAHITVRFGTTQDLVERVAKNELDLALTIGTHALPTLRQKVIETGKFLIVESTHKRRAKDADAFILTEPRYETEFFKKEFYLKFKKPPAVRFQIESWEMIAKLVSDGYGQGLIPDVLLDSKKYPYLKPAETRWFKCNYDVYVHYSRSKQNNSLLNLALENWR